MSSGAGGDDRGDDRADELDDAAHMHDLRAVLRTMPDEEPPMRGMAELMAAARARVGPTPTPSWWHRLSAGLTATMRRPAVLAMATVVVVASGALVVRHQAEIDRAQPAVATATAGPTAERAIATAPSAATPLAMAAGSAGGAAAAIGATGAAPVPAADDQTPAADDQTRRLAQNVPAAAVVPMPARRPPAVAVHAASNRKNTAPVFESSGDDAPGADGSPAVASGPDADTPTASPPSPRQFARPPADRLADRLGDRIDEVAAGPATPAKKPAATIASDAGSPVGQWLKQCQKAAAASDCDAVRRLAARISEADPAFYRDHVVKDAVLAHCLTTTLSE